MHGYFRTAFIDYMLAELHWSLLIAEYFYLWLLINGFAMGPDNEW